MKSCLHGQASTLQDRPVVKTPDCRPVNKKLYRKIYHNLKTLVVLEYLTKKQIRELTTNIHNCIAVDYISDHFRDIKKMMLYTCLSDYLFNTPVEWTLYDLEDLTEHIYQSIKGEN